MDWSVLTLPLMSLSLGAIGFLAIWLQSRAFDRRYGRDDDIHHPAGE